MHEHAMFVSEKIAHSLCMHRKIISSYSFVTTDEALRVVKKVHRKSSLHAWLVFYSKSN